MIRSVRKKHSRPERVNYLASVSDLMSALLFVFILTLAVAIIQARTAAGRADEEARHAKEAAERARVAPIRFRDASQSLKNAWKAIHVPLRRSWSS